MQGFFRRILVIDVTRRTSERVELPESVYRRYLGGKGLGTYLLARYLEKGTDPLGPSNPLIFATGQGTGLPLWSSARYAVYTKSPATGVYAESYSGGDVSERLVATGYDAIVLTGAADAPIIIEVDGDEVKFHDGRPLWGLGVYQAEAELEKNLGGGVVTIGPAGENLVGCALIANNRWRCAGRTGVGAVLGSKRVKGIVFKGSQKKPCYDEARLEGLRSEMLHQYKDAPVTQNFKNFGTPVMVEVVNSFGGFPTKYWESGVLPGWDKISGQTLREVYQAKPHACPKCFVGCGKMFEVKSGRHKGLRIEGPEYETIYAFGGLCVIDDLEEIAYLNDICDNLGMDTITAGNLVSFTIEAGRRGKISKKIAFGDVDGVAELLHAIARREGIGDVLARGIRHAAREWGLEELAVHVKGLEPAGYDPRAFNGMGLAYATSPRGACHLRSTFYRAEVAGLVDKNDPEKMSEVFTDFEGRLVLMDTFILCRFYRDFVTWESMAETLNAITGWDTMAAELKGTADRIITLTRKINVGEGVGRKDDMLPRRFFEPLKDSGKVLDEGLFVRLLDEYYRLRGWTSEGMPQKEEDL